MRDRILAVLRAARGSAHCGIVYALLVESVRDAEDWADALDELLGARRIKFDGPFLHLAQRELPGA